MLKAKVREFCKELEGEFNLIPMERKKKLKALHDYIQSKIEANESTQVIVICTHNSRRSHMGQLCLALGIDYYGLKDIKTYSGGTEATAFNPRAVETFERVGIKYTVVVEGENPHYQMQWKEEVGGDYIAFSKCYDTSPNPSSHFGAIMVCNEADEACPFVTGADFRLALPYEDPKAYDETPLEAEKYDERLREIGRELFYVLYTLKIK